MTKIGFPEIMRRIMEERNLKQADVCRMSNIQTSLMSEYLTGKKMPTLTNAIKIADALNISLDELAGITQSNHNNNNQTVSTTTYPMTKDETRLLSDYRNLNEKGQVKTLEYVDDLVSSDKYKKDSHIPNFGKNVG